MKVESLRPEFLIAVLVAEGDLRRNVRQALTRNGFRFEVYTDLEFFEEQLQEHVPHIILVDEFMAGPEPDLMMKSLKSISQDFRIIYLNTSGARKNSMVSLASGADDEISTMSEDGFELVHHLDLLIEKIYLEYQNEQLWDRVRTSEHTLSENLENSDTLKSGEALFQAMADISASTHLEDAVSRFLRRCHQLNMQTPVLYLKYVATQSALVVYDSVGAVIEPSQTLGFKVKESDVQELNGDSAELRKFLKNVYGAEEYFVLPLKYDRFIRGGIAFLGPMVNRSHRNFVENTFSFLQMKCETFSLTKKIEEHADIDFQTGGPTRRAFLECVETEVSRARRLGHPVSVIIGSMDQFENIAALGSLAVQTVSKLIYSQIRKTTRRTDEVAFVGKGEFMILLAHTSYLGASVKAERIRRAIEATDFPFGALRITMSFGVSEYPTLSTDTDNLIQTAMDAVDEVKKVTENKVSVSPSPIDFQPDFIPQEIVDYAKHRSLSK